MTLKKQLWLWLLITVIAMTVVATWIGLRNVQQVMITQISKDMQYSVNVSSDLFLQYIGNTNNAELKEILKPHLKKIAAIQIDGIELPTDPNIVNTHKLKSAFPTWFLRMVNFSGFVVESVLTDPLGHQMNLSIVMEPSYGQHLIWPYAKKLGLSFLACGLLIYCLALLGLQLLLRPYYRLIHHAKELHQKDFYFQTNLPLASDLRLIAETMNHLTTKTQMMFDEHRELNRMMRQRAYQDSVTGLANRRYFDSRFEQILSATEAGMGGVLFLVRVQDIKNYRRNYGIEHTDTLLKHIAAILTQQNKQHDIQALCHFGDADFAMIVMNIETSSIEMICKQLLHEFNQMHEHIEGIQAPIIAHIGAARFIRDAYHHDVLAQADEAIRKAQAHQTNHWILSQAEKPSLISINWTTLLQEKLDEEEVFIQYQPVFFYETQGTILFHNEALMRIKGPNGERFPAGMLLPLVDKMGLSEAYDKMIILQVLERVKDTSDGMQRYAINLSEQSLKRPDFTIWLTRELTTLGEMAHRVSFEFSEHFVKDNINQIKIFTESIGHFGVQVGLDHFGCGFSSYGYLDEMKIAYVKIDGSYIRNIHQNVDNQVIVKSFVEICHGLDILVIASTVEIEEEREVLMALHVDGMQGYFIGQPA